MKKFVFIIIILSGIQILQAQDADFIDNLILKKNASFQDMVVLFLHLNNIEQQGTFEKKLENLKSFINKIPVRNPDTELTVADFSLISVQYLKIKGGLFYMATKNGRYATRELMLAGILPDNTSEFRKISGEELMTLIRKVGDYAKK